MMLGVMVAVCVAVGNVSVVVLVAVMVELGVSELGKVLVAVRAILEGNACVEVVSIGVSDGDAVKVGDGVLVGDEGFAGFFVGMLVASGGFGAV
jgi:hypothetical protein